MKKWFAALRYIKPVEMEEFLENSSRDGLNLERLNSLGLFYFSFEKSIPKKYRYVVDISDLPKALYMETLLEDGWEYLGNTLNCHIWRKEYGDRRPEDFADKTCRRKHMIRMGILLLLVFLFMLGAAVALVYGAFNMKKNGMPEYFYRYLVQALFQVPVILYLGWAAKKLLF